MSRFGMARRTGRRHASGTAVNPRVFCQDSGAELMTVSRFGMARRTGRKREVDSGRSCRQFRVLGEGIARGAGERWMLEGEAHGTQARDGL